MKRYFLSAFMAIVCCVGWAQDALVIEWHNGLADIFPVSEGLYIDNRLENDSIFVIESDKILASYTRADIKRIAFDDEVALTDSVERAALVALYKATDGDNWRYNTNWCSDKPLGEWNGVGVKRIDDVVYVTTIIRQNNYLNGVIPIEIGNLTHLETLDLMGNKNISGTIPNSIGRMTELRRFELGWPSQVTGDIPKEIGNLSKLEILNLFNNSLTGEIPKELGNLTNINSINLSANSLSGSIPSEMGNLKTLRRLNLSSNQLTGEIPSELGHLSNLEELNLSSNQLTGEIPKSFNNLTGLIQNRSYGYPPLYTLDTWNNNLSSKVPSLFTEHSSWVHEWWNILARNPYNLEELNVPAPSFHVMDIDGNILDSKNYYPNNKLTAIFHWNTWIHGALALVDEVVVLYERYKNHGLEIVGLIVDGQDGTEQNVYDIMAQKGITWKNFISSENNMLDFYGSQMSDGHGYPGGSVPEFSLIDSDGRVVFSDWCNDRTEIASFLESRLGEGDDIALYESTDYSTDGQVKTLQSASTGKDIKVVIMGDGFSDRMIADGRYDAAMHKAMNAFFTKDIVMNYQDMFTVKSVTVVSKNERFGGDAETALGCFNNYQQGIGGNAAKVFNYAKHAINEEDIDDAIIIVLLNSELAVGGNEAGVCYMYQPETPNAWGRGASISFVPNFSGNGGIFDITSFENVLPHEALGHGFAKLADEYFIAATAITVEQKENYQNAEINGWYKNVDFTDNVSEVKWNQFINDSRYADEQIGIYEGGATYEKGVYRSTPTSLMGSNDTEFNAPSREAIWYRINKLTQGDEWDGTHEDFVKFDLATRSSTKKAKVAKKQDTQHRAIPRYRGASPVVMKDTWRNAK